MKISSKNDYRSCCPIARGLDILGDRWTLIVVRDMLMMGKHEYHEFLAGPEGIATNILSDRLKNLVCREIIQSQPHPDHKTKKLYYLTPKGKDLLPLVVELVLWSGTHYPSPDMPRERYNLLKKNPKKSMKSILQALEVWEKKNLQ